MSGARLQKAAGFTLIELMIALLLGLLVMGAAISIFLSNRQAYTATEGLGRVQENVRFAFELMARDIREAGANPCGKHVPLVNVISGSDVNWWTNLNSGVDAAGDLVNPWQDTLRAFAGNEAIDDVEFGDGAAERVAGTEAIQLSAADDAVYSVESHEPASARFNLSTADVNLEVGSLAVVCDARQASLFRATAVGGGIVEHASAGPAGPGMNCTQNLGLPADCATATSYTYQPNAMLARFTGSQWYVGNNDRGGTSLFLSRVNSNGGGVTNQELIEGVEDLAFQFLETGAADYVNSSAVTAWQDVVAVRVVLRLTSASLGGTTDGQPLRRTLTHVVSLRNRNP